MWTRTLACGNWVHGGILFIINFWMVSKIYQEVRLAMDVTM